MQLALAGRQRRTAAERHLDHVALGRPDERLGFGNKAGFVVDQPHARHGFDGGQRAAAAIFRECIGGKRDVAARDRDPALVEHGILQRRRALRGEIGFHRQGVGPGRNSPKDDQWNDARPPFAAPPEKSVHSTSCGSGKREKTNPCEAVKLEMTQVRPIGGRPPDQPALQRSASDFGACFNRSATRDEAVCRPAREPATSPVASLNSCNACAQKR